MSEGTPFERCHRDRRAVVADAPSRLSLFVLGGFEVRSGERALSLPVSAERLLVYLAVRGRPQQRCTVASTLWMDTTEACAAAKLRTALWRLRQAAGMVVVANGSYLTLASDVVVDLFVMETTAKAIFNANSVQDVDADLLTADLLPDWDEDWIQFERERLRQLRVHALEVLCACRSACGRHAAAIDAGQAAVAAEPFRESAQRTLIEAHVAEGNLCEAKRQFDLYSQMLDEALGFRPSPALAELIASAVAIGHGPAAR